MTRLSSAAPVRALKNSRRALTGKVTLGGGEVAGFESSLERDWLRLLDFVPSVIALREQPFTIYYEAEGRRTRYTPDVLAEFLLDGTAKTVVYEVKPLETLRADWQLLRPRFKAAIKHCRAQGWQFRIVTAALHALRNSNGCTVVPCRHLTWLQSFILGS